MTEYKQTSITVSTEVFTPIEKTWNFFTQPDHITKWYQASDTWHAPYAENDLRKGGKFITTMAAKDGSVSFNFEGTYTNVVENKLIEYTIIDGRKVKITFSIREKSVLITETFDSELKNPPELQQKGWQAILDSFKKYTESV